MSAKVQWREVSPEFGSAQPYGSCNAIVGGTVCGFPRRADGTCLDGHPSPPGWVEQRLGQEEES